MTTCKNCGTTFEGKFCSNCSQKADTHRFTVKHFAHEFFHAFTHADKGIFFLMKELFIRPGTVAREFNAGKRKKYFNPITYLLIVMAVQIYITQKSGINTYYLQEVQKQTQTEMVGSGAEYEKTVELMKVVEQQILEHSKIVNFLFLPILAFISWVMFKRAGSNYAEVLVLDVLWIAQILLLYVIVCLIPFLIYPPSVVMTMNIYTVVCFIYMVIALKQFFLQGWFATILKGLVIQILYYIAMFAVMLAVFSLFYMT